MEWRTIVLTTLIVSLLFLAIPIRIDPSNGDSTKEAKLFQAYVFEYKKPYRHDPAEYQKRFSKFQVNCSVVLLFFLFLFINGI